MKVYRIAKLFMFGVGFGFLSGCVHSSNHTRGSVALKHSDMEADICLGAGEVAVGDRLTIYRNQCVASEDGGLRGGGGGRKTPLF